MNLLLPKTYVNVRELGLPIFYLAGPIRGADDWQARAAESLDGYYKGKCLIVNPSRYDSTHRLYERRLSGDEERFARQVDWERFYMELAAHPPINVRGCLVFWLPCESEENPRPKEEGPYAQDTYGEIGEWRGRLIGNEDLLPRYRIAIGADPGFPGLNQIERNFTCALKHRPIQIRNSFESTLVMAITIANSPV